MLTEIYEWYHIIRYYGKDTNTNLHNKLLTIDGHLLGWGTLLCFILVTIFHGVGWGFLSIPILWIGMSIVGKIFELFFRMIFNIRWWLWHQFVEKKKKKTVSVSSRGFGHIEDNLAILDNIMSFDIVKENEKHKK